MIDRSGSIEGFFLEGYDDAADDIGSAIDSFSSRALALDLRSAYGRVPARPASRTFFHGRHMAVAASGSTSFSAGWCGAMRSISASGRACHRVSSSCRWIRT